MLRLALLLSLGTGLAGSASADERIWLEVQRPYQGWVEIGLNSLVEVQGRAGSAGRGVLDFIIVLDVSRSTQDGSGVDVNGNGHVGGVGWSYKRDVGSYLRHPQTSSDPGDSILAAEVEAVRRLVERLDPERTRIGLVSLRETAQVRSAIGHDHDFHMRQLEGLALATPGGRTHMAAAIDKAMEALRDAEPTAGPYRNTAIILLSDGKPTAPGTDSRAADEAVRAAREAGRRGTRIYTVALGVPDRDTRALREIAAVSRGVYTALEEPGDIIDALPNIDLLGQPEITVRNTTTSSDARAMRVWADGSFDGFVELRPGKNRIAVHALSANGKELIEERFVFFLERAPRDERERLIETRKLERLRDFLKARSLEVEMARELEVDRDANQARSLSVETAD